MQSLYSCNMTTKAIVNFDRGHVTPSDFPSGREVEEDEAQRAIRQGNIHFYNSFLFSPTPVNPSLDGDICEF